MTRQIVQDPPANLVHASCVSLRSDLESQPLIESASPVDADLIDRSIELVARWLNEAPALETKKDKQSAAQLRELIEDPDGVAFTMGFVDRVARPDSNAVGAAQLASLVQNSTLPAFLSPVDKLLLRAGAKLGRVLPQLVMPLARQRMRQLVGHMVVDSDSKALRAHLGRRQDEGYDLNVNLLGEAVLGENEADKRMQATLALLREPSIDYVSVKLSSVVSQLNYWAWDESRQRVLERLIVLFDAALASKGTFINLDMEEYHDLELTVSVFVEVLAIERFADLDAGIVIQAYLPDSLHALQTLVEAGNQRKDNGGGEIKIRVVKGANLAMERVEAAMHGWEQTPYRTKAETDANYKRLIDWVLTPANTRGVRIGVGSHNLFDVAFAFLLAERRDVLNRVEFEMLQGMSPGQARAVKDDRGSLLLYTPVVGKADFDVAISYLFRRLEENSAEDNFLRLLFQLKPGSPQFVEQAEVFRTAVLDRDYMGTDPQRTQDRRVADPTPTTTFVNAQDTDPALASNRLWAQGVVAAAATAAGPSVELTTDTDSIVSIVASCREAQPAWSAMPKDLRRRMLYHVADELEDRRGDLIAAMIAEAAKTLDQADVEISEAIDFARYYGDRTLDLDQPGGATFAPLGVVAVVPPWNFPLAIAAGGVLSSLAGGNTVVLKPAPETPRCAELVAECCWAGGVPADVLAFVRTPDNEVGQALITSVDGVILTGASETAAMFLDWKPELALFAETSGKNALIVTPSADLDLAAEDLVRSAFGHAGQKCSAASLAILVGDVYSSARFRSQLVDAVQSLVTGPAADLNTVVNPLVIPAAGKLQRALTTLDEGESWLVEPQQIDETLWSPGVRDGVAADSWFHQTECFGPVLGLMFAPTLEAAIELQNGNDFGLTGGIHSLDPVEVEQWLDCVEVGNAYVNRQITGAIVQRQPFGGWKKSTVGPAAKAGGPNYVSSLGTWTDDRPRDQAWLDAALQSDDAIAASHFEVEHDPTALFCEANIFRYRPLKAVAIRVGPGANEFDVQRVVAAANRWSPTVIQSSHETEDEEAFAKRISAEGFEPDRVRVVGDVSDVVRRAAGARQLYLDTRPVVGSGRIELQSVCREQAISRTLHRFGNLVL